MSTKMKRRGFLKVTALTGSATLLAACKSAVTPTAEPTAAPTAAPTAVPEATEAAAAVSEATTAQYKEAPMLAEQVAAGTLPPVEERLPLEPYVVGPGDQLPVADLDWVPGKYGGTVRYSQESQTGDPHIFIAMNEGLLWAPAAFEFDKGVHGNVVKGYEASADSTDFTFHMRKGLKWSDGVPVTTEDVRFAFEDVLMNTEVTPIFPARYKSEYSPDGAPCILTVVDDYTFKLTFDKPYGSFPAHIAISGWIGYQDLIKPKHYLQQFHIKYASLEDLKPLMEAESIPEDQWYNLFNAKQTTGWAWNITNEAGIGHPTLCPWIVTKASGGIFTFERNPYYYKVDTEGQQLPYIDSIRSEVVADRETLMMRALTGEYDYPGERASLKKLPLMKEQEDKGLVKIYMARMHRLPASYRLNFTYPDPVWRQVVQDLRFRQALSCAIDRQEIYDIFYLGQFGKIASELNNPEYNLDKANQLLDEMGMDKKDDEGFRLGPDGKRFEIRFDIVQSDEDLLPIGELVAEYWSKVGVYTTATNMDSALYGPKWAANEVMATAGWGTHDLWPYAYTDYTDIPSFEWQKWYSTGGEEGEEPPAEIKEIYANHKKLITLPVGEAESLAAYEAILKSYRDNIWMFIPVEHSYYPTFFTPRMRNVPTGMTDTMGIVTMHSAEQWFIEEE